MRFDGSVEIREHEGGACVAFAPDGSRFVVGDQMGKIVVRTRDGEALHSTQLPIPRQYAKHGLVSSIAWSPDGAYIASIDDAVTIRLRRADDLSVVTELGGFGALDGFVFGGGGRFLAVANRTLRILRVPTLEVIRTMPIARKDLDTFDVSGITCAPHGTVVATCDTGGYSEDENDVKTDVDEPQTALFDTETGHVRWLAKAGRELSIRYDRWRDCLYTVSYENGTTVWSPDGQLVRRWRPYGPSFGAHLAVAEPFLATMPAWAARVKPTIDLWDPSTFALIARADLPPNEETGGLSPSPDGTRMVTSMRVPGTVRAHGLRLWSLGLV